MVAITSSDMFINYTGSVANSSSTAAASLGPKCSSTAVASGANGLFADISSADNAGSVKHYRAIGFYLNSAASSGSSNSGQNTTFYFSGTTPTSARVQAALDATAATAIASATVTGNGGVVLTNDTTAPTGVSFPSSSSNAPISYGTGLALGTMAQGTVRFVWIQFSPQNGAAATENCQCEVDLDTSP